MSGAATQSPKMYQGKASPSPGLKNMYLNHRDTPNLHGNLLTPKADHYKHLVDHYKRTLEGLNTADHKNDAVKHTLDFLNRQHQSFGYLNSDGKGARGFGKDGDRFFRSNNENSNPILKNLPFLDKDGNVVNKSPTRNMAVIDQEYASTASIIQHAKTEKFMLDYEKFRYRPKKEAFNHDVVGKNKINSYFAQINDQIDNLA